MDAALEKKLSEHRYVELEAPAAILDDGGRILAALRGAADRLDSKVLGESSFKFEPQGFTALLLLSTSHLAIHTWPEKGKAQLDVLSCKEGVPLEPAIEHVLDVLEGKVIEMRKSQGHVASQEWFELLDVSRELGQAEDRIVNALSAASDREVVQVLVELNKRWSTATGPDTPGLQGLSYVWRELERRGLLVNDVPGIEHLVKDLDLGERETAPVHPGSEGEGTPLAPDDMLRAWEKRMVLRSPAVSLIGSVCTQNETKGDIDVLLHGPLSDELRHVMEFRLGRALPPELSPRLQVHGDTLGGPFTDHVPVYDLVLVPSQRPRTVVRMSDDDPYFEPYLEWLPGFDVEELEKKAPPSDEVPGQPFFTTYGILTRFADKILPLFPEKFDRYVELFCGNIEMLWCMRRDAYGHTEEVVNDLDKDIIRLHRICQVISDKELGELITRFDWRGAKGTLERLAKETRQGSALQFLYRELYCRRFSYLGREKAQMRTTDEGRVYDPTSKIQRCRARLQGVKLSNLDYRQAVRKYDGPGTFWFIDPPYPGSDDYYQFKMPNLEEQVRHFNALKGRALMVLKGDAKELAPVTRDPKWREFRFRWPHPWHGVFPGKYPKWSYGSIFTNYDPPGKGRAARKAWQVPLGKAGASNGQSNPQVPGRPFFKTFGSLTRFADKILPHFPGKFSRYVELYCGNGEMLWCFHRGAFGHTTEVLNDIDRDIVRLHRVCQQAGDDTLQELARMDWSRSSGKYKRFLNEYRNGNAIGSDIEFMYKHLYLRLCSFKSLEHGHFDTSMEGKAGINIERIRRCHERLQGVQLSNLDYRKAIEKFDSKDTFWFIDPPYPGSDDQYKFKCPDFEEQVKCWSRLQGRALVVLKGEPKILAPIIEDSRWKQFQFTWPHPFGASFNGGGAWAKKGRIFTNYNPSVSSSTRKMWQVLLGKADDDALMFVPDKAEPHEAVVQVHTRGKTAHLDLRFLANGQLMGWTLFMQKPGTVSNMETIDEVEALYGGYTTTEGNRYFKGIKHPARVQAVPKPFHPVEWLKVDGEVFGEGEVGATENQKGVIVAVAQPRVSWGLQSEDFHEYFLEGHSQWHGPLYFRKVQLPDEDDKLRPVWLAWLGATNLPRVLQPDADMPPLGHSAMPKSLMSATPRELRFWEAKTKDEAAQLRDKLVASKHFTEQNVKIVDGTFERVVTKMYLEKGMDRHRASGRGSMFRAHRCGYPLEYPKTGKANGPQCGKVATKAIIWADGRAMFPVCPEHVESGIRFLKKKNGEWAEISDLRSLPASEEEGIKAWHQRNRGKGWHKRNYPGMYKSAEEAEPQELEKTSGPTKDADGRYECIVSGVSLRHKWHPCDPEWIGSEQGCRAACCKSSASDQAGPVVTSSEAAALRKRGAVVKRGEVQARAKNTCHFLTDDSLCELHNTKDKPLECRVSPLRVLASGTVVMSHRHFQIKCHKAGPGVPGYEAYKGALVALFGPAQAKRIQQQAAQGNDRIAAKMDPEVFEAMQYIGKTRIANRQGQGLPGGWGKAEAEDALAKSADTVRLIKTKNEDEQYVLGIVLEPNDGDDGAPLDPDSQQDIYSKGEVRQAAHRFMVEFRNIGLMHRSLVNGMVEILESFVVPDGTGGFDIEDPYGEKQHVREGTWLLGLRIVDDNLWQKVKRDQLSGLSIGGSARRVEAAKG